MSATSLSAKNFKFARLVGKPALIAARVARQIGTPRSHTNCGAFVFDAISQNPLRHRVLVARHRRDSEHIDDQRSRSLPEYTARPSNSRFSGIRVLRAASQFAAILARGRDRATSRRWPRRPQRAVTNLILRHGTARDAGPDAFRTTISAGG